jgi:hypothetical protein
MAGVGYILIPFDGSRETHLSASEAKSQNVIDDLARETRLSELLDQRGMDVKFMFTERGVMIKGTDAQAMTVSRLVEDLPNLMPSQQVQKTSFSAANDDNKLRIASAFGSAARHFNVAPIRGPFTMAASDTASTVRGARPGINGSYGVRVLAA